MVVVTNYQKLGGLKDKKQQIFILSQLQRSGVQNQGMARAVLLGGGAEGAPPWPPPASGGCQVPMAASLGPCLCLHTASVCLCPSSLA